MDVFDVHDLRWWRAGYPLANQPATQKSPFSIGKAANYRWRVFRATRFVCKGILGWKTCTCPFTEVRQQIKGGQPVARWQSVGTTKLHAALRRDSRLQTRLQVFSVNQIWNPGLTHLGLISIRHTRRASKIPGGPNQMDLFWAQVHTKPWHRLGFISSQCHNLVMIIIEFVNDIALLTRVQLRRDSTQSAPKMIMFLLGRCTDIDEPSWTTTKHDSSAQVGYG